MILDGIAKYEIYGAKGLKKELAAILLKAGERAGEVRAESPPTWERVINAIKDYGSVVGTDCSTTKLGEQVVKVIGYLTDNSSLNSLD